jgi:hypothetical protein
MIKRYLLSIVLFGFMFQSWAQQTIVKVYPDSLLHSISPYIYGVNGNYSDESVKAIRQGGNRWTGYNWENGLSNAGVDYNNQSDGHLLMDIPSALQSQSGIIATYNHDVAKTYNQFFLTTIPAAGFVAANSGIATVAPSSSWNVVKFSKPTAYTTTPDLTDGVVYMDEYVNYLKIKQGIAAKGGINAYSIDNEPELWNRSHPLLHPTSLKMKELFATTLSAAIAIKKIDSTALVFGPAFANMYGMNNLNNNDNTWNGNIPKYGWFLALYLDSMKINSDKVGKRLVDVIDFHWYPEAQGDDNVKIVNTSGGAEPITQTAIKARLQAPRSLWDTTYVERSGLTGGQPLKLLKKVQTSIDKWNPGTKMGITEYRYGREDHFSGGLALADALGVFGKQNVFCANKWFASGSTMFQPFSKSAFDLYTNYDQNYSMFGTISIPTLNRSNDTLSSFASIDAQNRLHIITINKIAKSVTANFALINGKYLYASVYGFDSANATITKRDSVKNISSFNSCSYVLPAYSALHFVFEPLQMPKVVKAQTDTVNNKVIKLIFSKPLKSSVLLPSSFSLIGKSGALSITSAQIDSNQITLLLPIAIDVTDTSIYVTIDDIIMDTNNFIIKGLSNIKISNQLKGSTPQLLSGKLTNEGKTIVLLFSKALKTATNAFLISTTHSSTSPKSIVISADTLFLHLSDRLSIVDTISGSYISGLLTFYDNSTIANINSFVIKNGGPIKPLAINAFSIINSGFTIQLQTDINVSQESILTDFTITINGDTIGYSSSKNSSFLLFNLQKKIEYGNSVVISYKDNGLVRSIKGAYLPSFIQNISNTVSQEPIRVTIPARVEGESTYYQVGAMTTITNALSSNGKYIISKSSDRIAYRVSVLKDTTFTLSFNYACADNMYIKMTISDSLTSRIDTLMIARTASFTDFYNYGITKQLKKGKYIIELSPISFQFNIDYIDFLLGTHIPSATCLVGSVASTGQTLTTEYNGFISSTPSPSNFVLTVNSVVLPIKAVSFASNKLILTISDTIYNKQSVSLQLLDTTILTKNGGYLAKFTKVLKNSSMILKTFEPSQSTYSLFITRHFQLSHNLPANATISIFNLLGVKVMTVSAINPIISLDQLSSGCYFVVATINAEIIHQDKIILSK